MTIEASVTANKVLAGLYSSLSDYTEYEALFEAFDQFLDQEFVPQASGETWQHFFKDHFMRANEIFEKAHTDLETPSRYASRQPVPTAVLSAQQRLAATNSLFDQAFAHPESEGLIEDLKATKQWSLVSSLLSGDLDTPVLFQVSGTAEATDIVIASTVELLDEQLERRSKYLALRLAKPVWKPQLEALLTSVYDLTPSEIEIIQLIFEVADLALIAERRKRSIRTVRTQLASIYSKMNVAGQTQLVILIASLLQLVGLDETHSALSLDQDVSLPMRTIRLPSGTLAYTEFGRPDGQPVLLLNTSYPPEMNDRFRDACRDAGLRILSPYKPGSADCSPRDRTVGPELLAADYKAMLDHLGLDQVIVAGTASGGLYGLEFARQYPAHVEKLILVDTGVPFGSFKDLRKLPKTIKRTMMTARYMPDLLLAPHKIIAANFRRSSAGEARVVDYFFADSPVDSTLTRNKGEYYQLTRRMISYSFDDVPRLVSDVCRWAADWSSLLSDVSQTHNLVFVHGAENTMFQIAPIQEFCATSETVHLIAQPDLGQLQIFVSPQAFIEAVRR